jgi:capsular polysaccharide biosynthesis protein
VELTGYASIARRWWRALFAATLVGALIGVLAAAVLPPTYEATAQMLVGPVNTDLDTQHAAGGLARTYADLALTRTVLEPIASQFHIDIKNLDDQTKTTASEATRFVTVVVQNRDPKIASAIANQMALTLVALAADATSPAGSVTIVDAAEPPRDRAAPSIPLVVALTTAAGLVTALLLVVLMETFSRVFRDRAEVERAVHPMSVSVLPRIRNATARGTGSADLALVTGKLLASSRSRALERIAVVGTSGGDASAYAAARLATELAPFGGRVSVIDAGDGHAASLLRGWRPSGGPRTLASPGPSDIEIEAVRLFDGGTIELVHPPTPTEAAVKAAKRDPYAHDEGNVIDLHRVEQDAGVTVVDIGVPGSSAERLAWLRAAGRAMVVVSLDKTRRDDLERTLGLLRGFDIDLVGVVIVQRAGALSRFRPTRRRRRRTRSVAPGLTLPVTRTSSVAALPLSDGADARPKS